MEQITMRERGADPYLEELLLERSRLKAELKEVEKRINQQTVPLKLPEPQSSFREFDRMVVEKAYRVPRPYNLFTRIMEKY